MIFINLLLFLNVILFSILTITTTSTILQDQIDQLSKNDQENILKTLLSKSLSRSVSIDTAENWCCKIDPGVEANSQTRQTTFYVMKHGRHRCGYDGCGFLGWGRCTRWCSETWTELQYGVETYLVYSQRVCPNDQLTCCAQHIYVLGHCFTYTEIYNNQQLLAQLNELGIVIPGPSVG